MRPSQVAGATFLMLAVACGHASPTGDLAGDGNSLHLAGDDNAVDAPVDLPVDPASAWRAYSGPLRGLVRGATQSDFFSPKPGTAVVSAAAIDICAPMPVGGPFFRLRVAITTDVRGETPDGEQLPPVGAGVYPIASPVSTATTALGARVWGDIYLFQQDPADDRGLQTLAYYYIDAGSLAITAINLGAETVAATLAIKAVSGDLHHNGGPAAYTGPTQLHLQGGPRCAASQGTVLTEVRFGLDYELYPGG